MPSRQSEPGSRHSVTKLIVLCGACDATSQADRATDRAGGSSERGFWWPARRSDAARRSGATRVPRHTREQRQVVPASRAGTADAALRQSQRPKARRSTTSARAKPGCGPASFVGRWRRLDRLQRSPWVSPSWRHRTPHARARSEESPSQSWPTIAAEPTSHVPDGRPRGGRKLGALIARCHTVPTTEEVS